MMVIYLPVKSIFELESGNGNFFWSDKQKRQMNGRNYNNIERNQDMILIYLPVKFEFDWTNRFEVRVWKRKF